MSHSYLKSLHPTLISALTSLGCFIHFKSSTLRIGLLFSSSWSSHPCICTPRNAFTLQIHSCMYYPIILTVCCHHSMYNTESSAIATDNQILVAFFKMLTKLKITAKPSLIKITTRNHCLENWLWLEIVTENQLWCLFSIFFGRHLSNWISLPVFPIVLMVWHNYPGWPQITVLGCPILASQILKLGPYIIMVEHPVSKFKSCIRTCILKGHWSMAPVLIANLILNESRSGVLCIIWSLMRKPGL